MKHLLLILFCFLLSAAGAQEISGLGAMASPLAGADILPFTDVSDTTDSANGTTKKATMTQVQTFVMTSAKLLSLTTNGFVKTSGGDGTLSVDTATYLQSTAIDTLAELETIMSGINILAATEIDTLSEWIALAEVPETIIIAISDETTALTTGTAKVTFRMPFAMTLTAVRLSVGTAPTGSTIIVDINEAGSTIMTTNKLSIDASEKTSTTAATAAGITDSALADDAEITIDLDQVGSTIAGAGAKVTLIGTR